MIVMKFGGTSVDGTARMRAVSRIVADRSNECPLVVTSAMRGVTDELSRLLRIALAGDRSALEQGIERLCERHLAVAAGLSPGNSPLAARIEAHLRELRVVLRGVRLVGTATPRSSDAVLGVGELLAQELLAAALGVSGAEARVTDSRDVVVTDDAFGAARPDFAATRASLHRIVLPIVERGVIPVLGGYLGATRDGIPTTLGRGGSDLSASLFGLAIGAESIEIWTDVDGLMTCDPRVDPNAEVIDQVTFAEAAELASYGARVLHPASIDPAVQGGIEVVVRNSLRPERLGTRIRATQGAGDGVVAVAGLSGLERMSVRAPVRARCAQFAARIAALAAECGVLPLVTTSSPLCVDLLLPQDDSTCDLATRLADLSSIERVSGLAAVAIIGEHVTSHEEACRTFFALASKHDAIGLLPSSGGASLGAIVGREACEPLMRELHAACCERRPIGMRPGSQRRDDGARA